jgi:predicted HTH transcriptional regulator
VGFVGDTVETSQAYDLPKDAVREAIVNAVAHRDYFSKASVEVRLFSDRLEVWNPGEMPEGLPLSWLYSEHPSLPFNSLLADPLYLVRYIERAGTGIDVIVDGCKELGLKPPRFEVRNGFFVVTLYRHPEENKTGVKTDRKTSKKTGKKTSKKICVETSKKTGVKTGLRTSDAIIELMRVNPMISHAALSKMLGRALSSIMWQIAKLRKMGRIRRVGPDKGGHWEVLTP